MYIHQSLKGLNTFFRVGFPQNYGSQPSLVPLLFQQPQEQSILLPLLLTGQKEKNILLPALAKWVTAAFLQREKPFLQRFAKFWCGSLHSLNAGSGYGQRSENTAIQQGWDMSGKDTGWDLGHLWGDDLRLLDTYCLLVFMLFYGLF